MLCMSVRVLESLVALANDWTRRDRILGAFMATFVRHNFGFAKEIEVWRKVKLGDFLTTGMQLVP